MLYYQTEFNDFLFKLIHVKYQESKANKFIQASKDPTEIKIYQSKNTLKYLDQL